MQVGSSSAFPQSVAIYTSVLQTEPTGLSPQTSSTALPPVQPPSQSATPQNQSAPANVVYTPQSLQAASSAYASDGAAKTKQSGADGAPTSADTATSSDAASAQPGQLSAAESDQVQKLAARDREVRAHELAHSSVGGQYAGATSYTLQRGPNGVAYAIGGEVSIDLSPVANDPAATIRKMQQVRSAALAPADPSPQDWAVAAAAARIAVAARSELAQQQAAEARQTADATAGTATSSSTSTATSDTRQADSSAAAGSSTRTVAANGNQASDTGSSDGKQKQTAAKANPPLTSIQTYQELIALGLRKNSAFQLNAVA